MVDRMAKFPPPPPFHFRAGICVQIVAVCLNVVTWTTFLTLSEKSMTTDNFCGKPFVRLLTEFNFCQTGSTINVQCDVMYLSVQSGSLFVFAVMRGLRAWQQTQRMPWPFAKHFHFLQSPCEGTTHVWNYRTTAYNANQRTTRRLATSCTWRWKKYNQELKCSRAFGWILLIIGIAIKAVQSVWAHEPHGKTNHMPCAITLPLIVLPLAAS